MLALQAAPAAPSGDAQGARRGRVTQRDQRSLVAGQGLRSRRVQKEGRTPCLPAEVGGRKQGACDGGEVLTPDTASLQSSK